MDFKHNEIGKLFVKRSVASSGADEIAVSELDAALDAYLDQWGWDSGGGVIDDLADVQEERSDIVPAGWIAFAEMSEWLRGDGDMLISGAVAAQPHDEEFIPTGKLDIPTIATSLRPKDRSRVTAWWKEMSEPQRAVIIGELQERWDNHVSFD